MIKKTLYFGHPAYLSLRLGQLVIKIPELEKHPEVADALQAQREVTKPIEDIGFVVLDNKQIVITQGLIEALLANNCALISCDSNHMPVGLMLPLCGNTVQTERFRHQIDASLPLQKQLWQQTVKAKIYNQAQVLSRHTGEEINCMRKWSNEVRSGDPDNLEARAAVFYWRTLFGGVPGLQDFVRSRDGASPNNLLNYGYAILRAVVARGLVSSGLLPTLGIHHHNRYNAYCLADDLMEPYRPYVDELVYGIIEQRGTGVVELDREVKSQLLSIPTLDVYIAGKRSPLMLAVTQTTTSLCNCYQGTARLLVYPKL